MQGGESVDVHARKNSAAQEKATRDRLAQTTRPPLGQFAGGGHQKAALTKANERACDLLATVYKDETTVVTNAHVLEVLQCVGDRETWPTQKRDNVTPDGKDVPGMCLGLVSVLGGKGMQVGYGQSEDD